MGPKIKNFQVHHCCIPTDAPEGDGTLTWNSTNIVIVEIAAGDKKGIGYTYADKATASICKELLENKVIEQNPMDIEFVWRSLWDQVRNQGSRGICAMAIAAIDCALWDLKAKLLDLPLARLFGMYRPSIEVYGSGGFTTYTAAQMEAQINQWAQSGITKMKIKIGAHPEEDPHRVRFAREAAGPKVDLFVDANGAYTVKQALHFAASFQEWRVKWFEEPVSSDDLEGLRLIRERAPSIMDIAAGEYGYDTFYFKRMIDACAVDILQADATRCKGFTGFFKTAALCEASHIPLSSHCAPALHVALGCAIPSMVHLEYFHDHVRIENMLFDGVPQVQKGRLAPDLTRPGLGLEIKSPLPN